MPRLAFVAAVAGLLVIATIAILSRPAIGPGKPTAPPPPSPTSTSAASPSTSPSPTPGSVRRLSEFDVGQVLPSGSYRIDRTFTVPFNFALPDGWRLQALQENTIEFGRHAAPGGGTQRISLFVMDAVYPDPCHINDGADAVGSSVDDLVQALASMAGFDAGPSSDVLIHGVSGKQFELTNSIDTETAGCTGGAMLWFGTYAQNGGHHDAGTNGVTVEGMWVLDAYGTRVLVDASRQLDSSSAQAASDIVSTFAFDRPAAAPSLPEGQAFAEQRRSALNHVSFSYPTGWRLTSAIGPPDSYEASAPNRFDTVSAANARFTVVVTPLHQLGGCCPIEWMSTFQADAPAAVCRMERKPIYVDGTTGYLVDDGCDAIYAIGGPNVPQTQNFSRAIIGVPHWAYVFQVDGEVDTTAWLRAFLDTVTFPTQ